MATASNKRSTNKKQELASLLECSICLEPFDNPRTLPCFHSFCKNCLENFVEEKHHDDLNCPVCRAKFTLNEGGVAGMTKNHFICNMVEVMSIQDEGKCIPCTHCQEPSVGRCVTCELFMCEKCFKAHNDYPGFQDHDVLTMEELSKPENQSKIKNSSKCNQHPKKKLKYYCETCDELICRHCMDFDHNKQHKFAPLEQAAKSKRERLITDCETLERTVVERNKETEVLKEVRQSLNSSFNKAHRIINERKDKLLARLQARLQRKTYSMIEDTRRTFERKMALTNARINEAEIILSRFKASSDMSRSLLQDANDEEILRSYQSVQKNAETARLGTDLMVPVDNEDVAVMSGSPDEIDAMLLAEIEDIVEDGDVGGIEEAEDSVGDEEIEENEDVGEIKDNGDIGENEDTGENEDIEENEDIGETVEIKGNGEAEDIGENEENVEMEGNREAEDCEENEDVGENVEIEDHREDEDGGENEDSEQNEGTSFRRKIDESPKEKIFFDPITGKLLRVLNEYNPDNVIDTGIAKSGFIDDEDPHETVLSVSWTT